MDPAKSLIAKCGGNAKAADYAGVEVVTTYRWTYPREKGGTGGLIPQHRHARMIEAARQDGIELVPSDFYPAPQKGEAA